METHKAKIIRDDDKVYLSLKTQDKQLNILLTEDKANDIKTVFNELIKELKNGEYNFELEDDPKQDLFFHTSKEYITQLNSELSSVYKELADYKLLNEE